MSINTGKHTVKEIDGVRCTIIEKGITKDRVAFLKDLLEHNGLEIKSLEEEKKPAPPPQDQGETGGEEVESQQEEPTTYILGVTDLVFNPVIAVYGRNFKTKDGLRVTPDYWNQKTDKTEPNYWDLSKK